MQEHRSLGSWITPQQEWLEPFARSRDLTPNEASDLWRDTPMQRVGRAEAPIGVSQSRWETLSEEAV